VKNLANQRFGRLVALSPSGRYRKKVIWECRCDCGKTKHVIGCNLTNGGSTSCGCKSIEATAERNRAGATHGLGGTRTYGAWFGMIQRCSDTENANYAGRGIVVCEFLRATPRNFASLMGEKPETAKRRALSVDRIDTNGNYSCGNCDECKRKGWPMNLRWATQKQQMRNVRYNRHVTIGERTQTMAAWSEESGLKVGTIRTRLELGWSAERLLIPVTR
jgi:hypothetical protein